jgi:hypothetical protein
MTAEDRMERAARWIMIGAVLFVSVMLIVVALVGKALAHDHEHPEFDHWYETLMMPDRPDVRCCGKNDEYRCEAFVRDGDTWCRVIDDRVNPYRPPVAVGTEIFIPPHKYKFDQGNPTGHTVVFGRPQGDDFYVYCFVQGTGI